MLLCVEEFLDYWTNFPFLESLTLPLPQSLFGITTGMTKTSPSIPHSADRSSRLLVDSHNKVTHEPIGKAMR